MLCLRYSAPQSEADYGSAAGPEGLGPVLPTAEAKTEAKTETSTSSATETEASATASDAAPPSAADASVGRETGRIFVQWFQSSFKLNTDRVQA